MGEHYLIAAQHSSRVTRHSLKSPRYSAKNPWGKLYARAEDAHNARALIYSPYYDMAYDVELGRAPHDLALFCACERPTYRVDTCVRVGGSDEHISASFI